MDRRTYLKSAGTVCAAMLLAGCGETPQATLDNLTIVGSGYRYDSELGWNFSEIKGGVVVYVDVRNDGAADANHTFSGTLYAGAAVLEEEPIRGLLPAGKTTRLSEKVYFTKEGAEEITRFEVTK